MLATRGSTVPSDRRARAAWIVATTFVSGALAVGCEQILGLDDFTQSDASCQGATCDAGVDTGDVETGSVVDVVIPDVVNQASSWANGSMPSSPAEIEAGANPTTLASFVAIDAGADASVVFDNVGKKLYWNLAASKGGYTDVQQAADYCTSLGAGWRLPTRIELVTLLDSTRPQPAASPALTSITSNKYWTASYVRPITQNGLQYWAIDFSNGDVVQMPSGSLAFVICTLGGA